MLEGPRAARVDELDAAAALANRVFYPDGSGDMGGWFPALYDEENASNLRVILDGQRLVSMAGMLIRDASILGAALRIASIGSVCTLQDYKGRGLASRLVEDAATQARSLGAQLIMVSGDRALYRRMGFTNAGLFRTIRVDRGSPLPARKCRARPWIEQDLPEMAGLHESEPVRFRRGANVLGRMLRTGRLRCKPSRTWVVESAGGPVAYLCAQEPEQSQGVRFVRIHELAGSRLPALSCLPQLFRSYGVDRMCLETTAADAEMERLCREYGLEAAPHGFQGTVKIIDREGFFHALEGVKGRAQDGPELCVEAGPPTVFRLAGEELRLSTDPELAALAFGSVECRAPKPAPGALQKALARLFPLPLMHYGLDYI
jgi:GNAT superfamily N-acetyltransferase